ncbi:MAG: hypothetical protein IH851_01495 [Armatimonadetes bacterium]|nr:hypothetical protein [Armatimonadota bacterium]
MKMKEPDRGGVAAPPKPTREAKRATAQPDVPPPGRERSGWGDGCRGCGCLGSVGFLFVLVLFFGLALRAGA